MLETVRRRRAERPRRWRVAVTAVLVGACLAAAGSAAAMTQSQHSQKRLYSLKLGIIAAQLDPLMWTAIKTGAFLQAGLNVTVVPFDSGVPEIPALSNGNIDVAYMAITPLISLASRGTHVHAVALGEDSSSVNGIVVHPDSGIANVAQLKGKSVAYVKGSIIDFALGMALKSVGLATSDVNGVNIPVALEETTYHQKSTDALFATQLAFVQLQGEGAKVLVSQSQIKGGRIAGLTEYVANDSYSQKYPEAIVRFVKGLDIAYQQIQRDPGTTVSLLEDQLGLTGKEARSVVKTVATPPASQQLSAKYVFNMNHNGLVGAIKPVLQFMKDNDQLSGPVNVASLVDPSYLEQYVKSTKGK